ncbi:galectin-related protein isoform X1 [Haplochromis burtoni]|uniref:galectin-related protein isoform X1 n=1 Tax=Haplochromis burtoni TaxID=8153 RepID=UPI001C2D3052|nr:galectin-related protein isoform X1 [Haplochromis burtoni]
MKANMAETHSLTAAQGRKKWNLPQRGGTEPRKANTDPPDRDTERKLAVPFRGRIPGGMQLGKRIIVIGTVNPHPDRFYIALTCGCGTSREPPPDVALEMCVRFKDRQVLRRACMSGSWGDVDKAVPFFPFIRDQPFKIEIRCEQSRFRVFVDGQQLFYFHHRVTSLKDIDTLWIKGSIIISKLG